MDDDIISTNSVAAPGTNAFSSLSPTWLQEHEPGWLQQHEWLQILLVAIAAPFVYYLMVMLGRSLKRKHGVQLGVLYHVFSLGFAVFLPAALLRNDWPLIHHIGAFTVIFGGVFVISLVDRYVWELYFKQLQNIDVPKFLPEVVRLGILVLAAFVALEHFYGKTVQGLIIAP